MNGKIVNLSERTSIEAEAAAWLVQLDGGNPSAEDLRAFREWVKASPRHKEEILRLARLWDDLDVLAVCAQDRPAVSVAKRPLWRRPSFALGSAVMAGLFAGLLLMTAPAPEVAVDKDTNAYYATAVGEQRTIALSDGSTVVLNTGSAIEARFDREKRIIKLISGEGHFDVAHDASRPFEVEAGSGAVRAIGTAFSVQLQEGKVEVTVTEGRVQIASRAELLPPSWTPDAPVSESAQTVLATVSAGQKAVYQGEIQSVQRLAPEIVERELAWLKGMLVFEGDSLEQVIEEVSRYTSAKIVISDPHIRDLKIGGYFKAGETDLLLKTLQSDFGIQVERVDENSYYLFGSSS